jgi:RimJ/RimL family protein N-acetyltransferase
MRYPKDTRPPLRAITATDLKALLSDSSDVHTFYFFEHRQYPLYIFHNGGGFFKVIYGEGNEMLGYTLIAAYDEESMRSALLCLNALAQNTYYHTIWPD